MDIIYAVEIFGTIIGIAWIASWLYKDYEKFYFHKKDAVAYLKSLGRYLGIEYFTKLLGEPVYGMLVLGKGLRSAESMFGKIAARYGTAGIGSETATAAMNLPIGVESFLLIFWVVMAVIEVAWGVHKNRNLLYDGKALGTLVLEVFVTFCAMGFVGDTLLWR